MGQSNHSRHCKFLPLLLILLSVSVSAAAPANDSQGDAMQLPFSSYVLMENQNNIGATIESGEVTTPFGMRRSTVWYRWTAPASGLYAFEIIAADFDTIIGVRPGSAFNYNPRGPSHLVFQAQQGVSYSLAVGGFGPESDDQGHFAFTIAPAASMRADLLRAWFSPQPVSSPGSSVLTLEIETLNGLSEGELVLRTATGGFLLSIPFDDSDRVSVDGTVGTYEVTIPIPEYLGRQNLVVDCSIKAADGYEAAFGYGFSGSHPIRPEVELSLPVDEGEAADRQRPTLNGIAASRTEIDLSGNRSIDFDLSVSDDLSGLKDGTLRLISASAMEDPDYHGRRIAAEYPFSPSGSGAFLGGTISATEEFDLPIGDYLVSVILNDGVGNGRIYAPPFLPGPFAGAITVVNSAAAANDAFESAAVVSGPAFSVTGDTSDASVEFGENREVAARRTLWYAWQAPADGVFEASASASDFDAVVSIFQGSRVLAADLICSSSEADEARTVRVRFAAVAGEIYKIRVGGANDDQRGAFALNGSFLDTALLPALTSFVVDPATADISSGPAQLGVSLGFSVPGGLAESTVEVADYRGIRVATASFGGNSTETVGSLSLPVGIPAGLPPFPLSVMVRLRDTAGEETVYDAKQQAFPSSFSGRISVVNDGTVDLNAPRIVSSSVSPDPVDASFQSQAVTVAFEASDDVGIRSCEVSIIDPNGRLLITRLASPSEVTAETSNGIAYAMEFSIPEKSVAGTWSYSIRAVDNTDSEAVGTGTFAVISPEQAAPSVSGLTVLPSPVVVGGANDVTPTLTLSFTDDSSGLRSLDLRIIAPSGAIVDSRSLAAEDIVTGDALNGTLQTSVTIGGQSPSGSYDVAVDTEDAAGQRSTDVVAGSFAVVNTEVAPPVVTQISVSPQPLLVDGRNPGSGRIRLDFTDDGSGLGQLRFEIRDADGSALESKLLEAGDIAGGTVTDGYFDVPFALPAMTPSGSYPVVTHASDAFGRERNEIVSGAVEVVNTDVDAPVVVGFSVLPAHVYFDGSADVEAQLEIRVSDDGSGIEALHVGIFDANGAEVDAIDLGSQDLTSGTTTDGVFRMSFTLPQGGLVGTYSIRATTRDRMGRVATDIPVGSFMANSDAAPQITGVRLTPAQLVLNDAPGAVAVAIDFMDDFSGLATLRLDVRGPGGNTVLSKVLTPEDITSGDSIAGTLETTLPLGRFAPAGIYSVSGSVLDQSGVGQSGLDLGSFDVANIGVAAARLKVLSSFYSVASYLLVFDRPEQQTVRATLRDNTGIQSVRVLLTRPDGSRHVERELGSIAGSPRSYEAVIDFSSYSMPGVWRTELVVTDTDGNELLYSDSPGPEEIYADRRLPSPTPSWTSFYVFSSGDYDVESPVLTSLWFDPGSVIAYHQSQEVRVNLVWRDNLSGFDRAVIEAYAPSGARVSETTIDAGDLVLGSLASGAAAGILTVPQGTEPGQLRIATRLYDAAGNVSFYDGSYPAGVFRGLSVTDVTDFGEWMQGFPDLTDRTEDGDADFDGLSNYVEFLLGHDPANPSAGGHPRLRVRYGRLELAFQPGSEFQRRIAEGFVLTGQTSTDLKAWTTVPIEDLGAGYFGIKASLGADAQRFLRLIR